MHEKLYIGGKLVRQLNFPRLTNLIKIHASYWISIISKKSIHWGKPVSISIEPTTSCNLSCPECPSGLKKFSRPTGMMRRGDFEMILKQMGKHLQYITLYFQGEPLLNKEFTEFVRMAKCKGIFTATSTNAHFLTGEAAKDIIQSGLDRLIVSLDGTDADTYVKYRKGGDFDLVVENIRRMVKARKEAGVKHPFIELQFLVLKHNQHQLEEIKKLGKEFGVDKVTLKTAQVYEFEEGNDFIPDIDKYSRYKKFPDGVYRIKNKLPNRCFRMWSGCVLTWDLRVVPCCFDKDARHQFGSMKTETFDAIWKSEKYTAFRQQILKNRAEIEICRNCTEGL